MTTLEKLEKVVRQEGSLKLDIFERSNETIYVYAEENGFSGLGDNLESALVDLLANMGAL